MRGALDNPTINVIGTAHRSTDTVTTAVKATVPRGAAAMPRSLAKGSVALRFLSARRRRLPDVSDETSQTTPATPAEAELHTESHDPSVPPRLLRVHAAGLGRPRARPAGPPDHARGPRPAGRSSPRRSPASGWCSPRAAFKVRSYDTDYRFRPDTAHTYFCGNQTSDAVLVIDGRRVASSTRGPRSERTTDEFFRDRQYGELWVGRRPSLKEISDSLGLEVRHLDEPRGRPGPAAARRASIAASPRPSTGMVAADESRDADFARVVSELRLVKDDWEIAELQTACDITTLGFEDSVAEWDRVLRVRRALGRGHLLPPRPGHGQRHRLRLDLRRRPPRHHAALDRNAGPITPGELVLLDMGVETTTSTPPTSPAPSRSTAPSRSLQRKLYDLVYAAQQAGIDAVRPGAPFTDRPRRRDGACSPRPRVA